MANRTVIAQQTAHSAELGPDFRSAGSWQRQLPARAANDSNSRRGKFLPLCYLVGLVVGAAGCAVPPRVGVGGATSGERVVIVVSGTANEPRPVVTSAALAVLRDAAGSTDVSGSTDTRSSVAIVVSADGGHQRPIELTPRRADGSVEHGLSRQSLIDGNVRSVVTAVGDTAATAAGLDLLGGISAAVRGVTPGTLIVVSSGLSTAGGLDLRQVGWQADPASVAKQLAGRDLLPELAGWHVLFTGLGAVAGAQPPLPDPTLDTLTGYWQAICRAAGAVSCDVDATQVRPAPPLAAVAEPVVPVPDVTSVVGPNGQVTTTVSDGVLGFAGDSAALSPSAQHLLTTIAAAVTARLAGRPDATVGVVGYAADPPGSTDAGRRALARQRADAVAAALADDGVTQHVSATGVGTQPGVTAMVGGRFDEDIANTMRRVVITY